MACPPRFPKLGRRRSSLCEALRVWGGVLVLAGISLGQVLAFNPEAPDPVVAPPPFEAPAQHAGPDKETSPSLPAAAPQSLSAPTNPAVNSALDELRNNSRSADLIREGSSLHKREKDRRRASFEELMENARRLRKSKWYDQARGSYVDLLKSGAPEEMQKSAMLELALMARAERELPRAQQILAQYLQRWPGDFSAPEVLLEQGEIYREMGAWNLALAKFYSVITTALVLKTDRFDYYQAVVLRAQTEIAETQLAAGRPAESIDALERLLKLESPALDEQKVRLKLVQSLAAVGRHDRVVVESQTLLGSKDQPVEEAELRYHLATSLRQLGRNAESLQQVFLLLQCGTNGAPAVLQQIRHWKQRAGNEIANQLYNAGDYFSALQLYEVLLGLDPSPEWQLPLLYQIGLAQERLEQPTKAAETFGLVIGRLNQAASGDGESVKFLGEMAHWRKDLLEWKLRREAGPRHSGAPSLVPSLDPPGLVKR